MADSCHRQTSADSDLWEIHNKRHEFEAKSQWASDRAFCWANCLPATSRVHARLDVRVSQKLMKYAGWSLACKGLCTTKRTPLKGIVIIIEITRSSLHQEGYYSLQMRCFLQIITAVKWLDQKLPVLEGCWPVWSWDSDCQRYASYRGLASQLSLVGANFLQRLTIAYYHSDTNAEWNMNCQGESGVACSGKLSSTFV